YLAVDNAAPTHNYLAWTDHVLRTLADLQQREHSEHRGILVTMHTLRGPLLVPEADRDKAFDALVTSVVDFKSMGLASPVADESPESIVITPRGLDAAERGIPTARHLGATAAALTDDELHALRLIRDLYAQRTAKDLYPSPNDLIPLDQVRERLSGSGTLPQNGPFV
ncbi:MAG: hypothetical protein ACRDFS_09380, partial [Chloroflexota bacterium]